MPALLSCLALAGCLTVDVPAIVDARDDDAQGQAFARLPEPSLGGEPSIAAAADGLAAYVVAPAGDEGLNRAWRSVDGGTSWESLGPVAEEFGTNDATIALRPDGSVWVGTFWSRAPPPYPQVTDSSPFCTAVSVSRDGGASWDTNPFGCGIPIGLDERPWLAASARETFLLHHQPAFGAWTLSRTTDNAQWVNLPTPAVGPAVVSPPVATDEFVAFTFGIPSPSAAGGVEFVGPFLATSRDSGVTWDVAEVARDSIDGRFQQLAMGDDVGIVAWSSLRDDGTMQVRASRLDGDAWIAPMDISVSGTSAMPWAAASGSRLLVAWLHADESAHPHAVAADAEWRVRVWRDGQTTQLPHVVHRGPLCSAYGAPLCPDGRSPLGDFFSAAAFPDGRALVAVGVDADGAYGFNAVPLHVIVEER